MADDTQPGAMAARAICRSYAEQETKDKKKQDALVAARWRSHLPGVTAAYLAWRTTNGR